MKKNAIRFGMLYLTAFSAYAQEPDAVVSPAEQGFPVVLVVPVVILFISIAYFMNQKK